MDDVKKKLGAPTKYKTEYIDLVYRLSLLGLTDVEMSSVLGIDQDTFNRWKKRYPVFYESIKKGKEKADSEVSKKLHQRAIGYSHKEEKIFCNDGEITRAETVKHYPPETAAAIFWLKNRQSKKWRDRIEKDVNMSHKFETSEERDEALRKITEMANEEE